MANQFQRNGFQPARDEDDCSGQFSLLELAWRVLTIVLILAICWAVFYGIHVLLLAFTGLLFAVFLTALSGWVSRHTGLAHGWALTLVVLGLFVAIGGLGYFLADRIAVQAAKLAQDLPRSLEQTRAYMQNYEWGRVLLQRGPKALESAAGSDGAVPGVVHGVTDVAAGVIVVLFVGIFGAAEPKLYRAGLLHLVPFSKRRRVAQALDAVVQNLHWWIVGQVILMILIGVTSAAGLAIIGVSMALVLGLITGLMEIIPYVGAWLSAILAALVAVMIDPYHLVFTLLLYLGLHILEGYVLVPLIQRRAVHLPPALTLVAQLLLAQLLGFLGLLVAAPLTVSVIVFVKMFYVQDALGDQSVATPVAGPQGAAVQAGDSKIADPINAPK